MLRFYRETGTTFCSSKLYFPSDFNGNCAAGCKFWRCCCGSTKGRLTDRVRLLDDLRWFSVAINSFVAQNYGAHNFSRAGRGYRAAMISMTVWGIFCSLLLILCGGWLFQLFITEPDVVPMGINYLTILGFSQMFMCWEGVNTGAYCGFGKTLPPSIVGIVFTAARIPAALILSSTSLGLDGIWWSLSISSVCKGTL